MSQSLMALQTLEILFFQILFYIFLLMVILVLQSFLIHIYIPLFSFWYKHILLVKYLLFQKLFLNILYPYLLQSLVLQRLHMVPLAFQIILELYHLLHLIHVVPEILHQNFLNMKIHFLLFFLLYLAIFLLWLYKFLVFHICFYLGLI